MIGTYEIIYDDLFGIAQRVKGIDSDYFIVRNYKTRGFEVHARGQRGSSLALCLPFEHLDARSVEHVLKTRAERHSILLAQMEEENEKLTRAEIGKVLKNAEYTYESILSKEGV
ncbi:MAG: hypothetical protein FWH03_01230 [Firmicutes bacterium]|nr:hypothetical protein [Bacillota bacterium]